MPSRTKKLRGSRTHGRGKKAGRGAGIIGGHGNAGLHKHEKLRMLKAGGDHFGRRGFKRPQKMVYANTTMNVGELAERLETLVSEGSASKSGDRYSVDLTAMGIDKLLGNGSIEASVDVVVSEASAIAREKLETAGGSVVE